MLDDKDTCRHKSKSAFQVDIGEIWESPGDTTPSSRQNVETGDKQTERE